MDVDANKKPAGKRSKKDTSPNKKRLAHSEFAERYYAGKAKGKAGRASRKFATAGK